MKGRRRETGTTGSRSDIALSHVWKRYGRGRNEVVALRDVSYVFPAGSFTAVMGPSGSGKSTMIQCAAGLDKPTEGEVTIGDLAMHTLKEPHLTKVRRQRIGFVFQAFNLLPGLTARENILLPMELDRRTHDPAVLDRIAQQVGIAERMERRPSEMSGGQQQRVSIARALLPQPDVVFADEPTGALDIKTAHDILELLRSSVDSFGQTLVMVTHDPSAAAYADRVLMLADGAIVDELDHPAADLVASRLARLEA